ncbi:serine hydrolase-like protein [Diorhabda carinulata]|uniref:serine hydrolase-like protein n=1 Tax=Diorhabda carinulata TaxID=1163345 RepID=UPI0025A0E48A|nr:serine hydrolase-like protein [Diorhabda carinulata]
MNVDKRNKNLVINEFQIPVPWGHIAIKAWGDNKNPHVLLFHGIADNAGSFDNLIPYLSASFYYICVDLPGHGFSSPFPPHLPIHSTDFLIVFKLVVDYFEKQKYTIIGHSYGGQIGLLFARVYPQHVEKFISLDGLVLFAIEAKESMKILKSRLEKHEEIVAAKPETYTYEEALNLISKNRFHGEVLTREACEPLLKRCLHLQDNGRYIITTDQRIKSYINPLHDMRYRIETLKYDPIKCPTLMIYTKLNDRPRKKYHKLLEKLHANKNITVQYIDGDHDIHNKKPTAVAPYINKFLLIQKSKV